MSSSTRASAQVLDHVQLLVAEPGDVLGMAGSASGELVLPVVHFVDDVIHPRTAYAGKPDWTTLATITP
jgi:hypothetical protein